MGNMNQAHFVEKNAELVKSPILEIGSRDYGKPPDFRSIFPGHEYTGVDMQDGKGVDIVLDMTDEFEIIDDKMQQKRFKTIFCFSVLEHCHAPFKFAQNTTHLLECGGLLFISVPFSWEIHDFPADYWRFTPDGIKTLFPELDFETHPGLLCTSKEGEFKPLDRLMFRSELSMSQGLKLKQYGYFTAAFIYINRKLKLLPAVFDYPYSFPPVLINMIGKKKTGEKE